VVFSSSHFLFYFLPIFLAVYFLTPAKNIVLLIFSLLFYAWGEGSFVLLLIFSSLFNYTMARAIDRVPADRPRKLVLFAAIAVNLVVLWYFKYFAFTFSSLIAVLGPKDLLPPDVHLPIGISFFTFHAISYLVDVYRRDLRAERNPVDVMVYISMFRNSWQAPSSALEPCGTRSISARSRSLNSRSAVSFS
jgi:alginate O-acetyltransferase complex protein AlgI